ncbi:MAG: heparan-alpha-glucosaminide N-acetyltransferase domain-containing protein [Candidatus Hodarchaeota archaeon]
MKRLKSLDTFRGLAMLYMLVGHLITWWPVPEIKVIMMSFYISILSPLGAAGFTFTSGISTFISYRNRLIKVEKLDNYNLSQVKYEYLFRALFIIILGLIYNIFVAILYMDPLQIWAWFILLTLGVCLLISWPLLKTSKIFRLVLGALIWIFNQIFLILLTPFEGQFNLFGFLYHGLYHPIDQNIILSFLPFFLVGTVIGDIIYDLSLIDNDLEKRKSVKTKLLYPFMLIGTILIVIGFYFLYPSLFTEKVLSIKSNIWWLMYSLGIEVILVSVFITVETYEIFKPEKSYRFLYYFSYYSLTVFLLQNINYFFFYQSLYFYNIWFYILITVIIYGLFLRFAYNKWGPKFSLKIQIGRLASGATEKVMNRSRKNLSKIS